MADTAWRSKWRTCVRLPVQYRPARSLLTKRETVIATALTLQEDLKSLVIQEHMASGPEGAEALRMVKEDPEPLYNKLVVQHANGTFGCPSAAAVRAPLLTSSCTRHCYCHGAGHSRL